ncbi:LOW QUALITY PROTEIN: hypothetical protein ElyMa_003044900 [Elysia marginata]|uniref:Uncharacterized protein n=1 Tax=Elysia marginata TaxID=1093978 RepID=A0AAV4IKM7_9GAST|nr:LOW QUALITY PROTEIN: hypothetical protein ElyMa_003044900 [Elysia marginata]
MVLMMLILLIVEDRVSEHGAYDIDITSENEDRVGVHDACDVIYDTADGLNVSDDIEDDSVLIHYEVDSEDLEANSVNRRETSTDCDIEILDGLDTSSCIRQPSIEVEEIRTVDYEENIFQSIITNVKPPLGLGKRGRPKGSNLTVLGGERKRKKVKKSTRSCISRLRRMHEGDDNRGIGLSSIDRTPTRTSSSAVEERKDIISDSETSTSTSLSRSEFFAFAQELLSSCKNFNELCLVATSVSRSMKTIQLPNIRERKLGKKDVVDSPAMKILLDATPDFQEHLLPVKIFGDGNCVPRSLSLLSFGDQDQHQEIRCRIVIELATNFHDFLNLPHDDLNL